MRSPQRKGYATVRASGARPARAGRASRAAGASTHAERSFGFHCWSGEVTDQVRTHTHVDVEANYLLSGSARYLLAGRYQALAKGQLAVFWGGIPHRIFDVTPGSRMVWLTVPIAWFMEWDLGEPLVRRMLSGDLIRARHDGRSEDVAAVRRWGEDLASGMPALRAAALHEVRARMHRLAHAEDVAAPARGPSRGRALGDAPGRGDHVQRISAFLVAHFRDGITMADVAAATDLHPNYASALFKASCGMSPWDYLTRLRVSHAQRLLLTTDRKVTTVATDSGFNSQSNFYEAFANFVGQPPRAYRREGGRLA